MVCKYCIDEKAACKIKVARIETKCKYHCCPGLVYSYDKIAPAGICRELFYSVYPECLSLLYSGKPRKLLPRKKGMTKIMASCPAPDGVKVEISVKDIFPPPVRIIKEITEEICKFIYRPLDGHFRRVFIRIIDKGNACPKNFLPGSIFEFNTIKKDELCPAGFAAIYPYIKTFYSTHKDGEMPEIKIHCPDYVGVTYEIKDIN
ncbi:MAG: hypothetical protein UT30_C0017G0011 [Candidatus Uhrbacteria bacterium GW2011_GWF2_39_13]|uniref:TIGR04076 family protein n=1 Tax=Candidatus Uhrbacteria bacterium GW2011_GWF2_39_13 TaxID=1618995 RepID=A0A0G0QQE5_9BACT|nr:MAG: hypothetical protein UT30_C0017G0011 [Candidatus Uhrbacteria bacterium GW2011_GWF2_39_13]